MEGRSSITAPETAGAGLEDPREVPVGLTEIRLPNGIYQWLNHEQVARREERPRQQRKRHRGRWELAAAAAALLLVFVIAGAFVHFAVREAASRIAPERLEAPSTATEPWASAAGADSAQLRELRTSVETEIEATVRSWAGAWSSRDVDRYLSFYSHRFALPDGMSRSGWESLRRDRIARGDATVTLDELETLIRGPGSVVARFVETFRTPYSVDRVAKTLELVKESGRWKILAERSAPV